MRQRPDDDCEQAAAFVQFVLVSAGLVVVAVAVVVWLLTHAIAA